MSEAEESLERERAEAAEAEKKAKWTAARLAALQGAQDAVQKCAELLDDIAAERTREDEALQELQQCRASVEANADKTAEGR
eukprot:12388230-Prorocentrum_lima.AAC.1